jgi:hypothetical protein
MPTTAERLNNAPNTEPSNDKEPLEIREFSSLNDVAKNYIATTNRAIEDAKKNRTDINAALKEVDKLYIEDNFVKEEAELCAILSNAKLFMEAEKRMQKIRDKLDSTNDQKKIKELKRELRKEKDSVIPFNHQVRDFLFENGDFITPSEMKSLLAKMNKGLTGPFEKLINGFGAEVAVFNFIKDMPGVIARPATDLEDAKGVDIVITSPRRVELDVKSGGNQGDGMGNVNELDIDRSDLEVASFELTSVGKRKVRTLITTLLN